MPTTDRAFCGDRAFRGGLRSRRTSRLRSWIGVFRAASAAALLFASAQWAFPDVVRWVQLRNLSSSAIDRVFVGPRDDVLVALSVEIPVGSTRSLPVAVAGEHSAYEFAFYSAGALVDYRWALISSSGTGGDIVVNDSAGGEPLTGVDRGFLNGEPGVQAPPTGSETVDIVVENRTGHTIVSLFVASSETVSWGADALHTRAPVADGETVVVECICRSLDARIEGLAVATNGEHFRAGLDTRSTGTGRLIVRR